MLFVGFSVVRVKFATFWAGLCTPGSAVYLVHLLAARWRQVCCSEGRSETIRSF
ncbi:hypothetical protein AvCA_39290 [Azotobacter vinelandii CA]|uniref:Uncharacterized protein n=2 Tax=Azotobacter vinelandii TaxID=354 RepID=C1DSX6_AZOVD|nr:hypothetical protein Avin_39290 [Azotobacter vinelandii DJ]AGK16126.1 hypothetical protein AvCA_39290 [Azotobacter vinelandii CA]AGK21675.1 hypothetical protein AvCA6_39290 [Azotobacter vinelandii CA6]